MQIEIRPENKGHSFFTVIYDNKSYLILLFFLLFGIFSGSLLFGTHSGFAGSFINSVFYPYFRQRINSTVFSLFFFSFSSSLIFLSAVFIVAFGICGIPFIPAVLFIRGLGTSAVACVFYNAFSLKGVAYFSLVILPPILLFDVVLLWFSSSALDLSDRFLVLLRDLSSRGILLRPFVAMFLKKTAVCILLSAVSALLDAVLCSCLSGFFAF